MTGIEKTSGILIFPDRYATPILKEGDYPLVGGECKRVVRIDKYRGIFEVEMSDRLVLKKYINRPEKSDKVDIELWLKEDVAADRVGRAFDSGGLVNGYVEAQFGEEEPDTWLEFRVDEPYTPQMGVYEKAGHYFVRLRPENRCFVHQTKEGARNELLEFTEEYDFKLMKDSLGLFEEKRHNSRIVCQAL